LKKKDISMFFSSFSKWSQTSKRKSLYVSFIPFIFCGSVVSERQAWAGSGVPAAEPQAARLPQPGGAAQAPEVHGRRSQTTGGPAAQGGGRAGPLMWVDTCVCVWVVVNSRTFSVRSRTEWRWRGRSQVPSSTAKDSPKERWTWWFCSWWITTAICSKWVFLSYLFAAYEYVCVCVCVSGVLLLLSLFKRDHLHQCHHLMHCTRLEL